MNTKVKKGIDIGAIVLFCIVFILGIFTVTIMITTKTTGVPSIFGYAFVDIQTPSMEGTLDVHDVAVVKLCDLTKDKVEIKAATNGDVKNGDGSIITFWDDTITSDGSRVLNTHMVVEVLYSTTDDPNSGIIAFRTQGTANATDDLKVRLPSDIVGVFSGTKLAGFGNFTNFLQSWYGFLILIVLPLTAFLVWRIIILVKTAKEYKAEVNVEKEGTIENLEAQLAALKAQLTAGGGAAVAAPLTEAETEVESAPASEAESEKSASDVAPEEAAPEVESEKAASEVKTEEAAPAEAETAPVTDAADEVESEKASSDVKPEEAAPKAESEQASAKDEAAEVTQSLQEESAPKAEKKSTAGAAKKSTATKPATKTAAKSSASKTTTTKPAAANKSTAKTTAAKTTAKSSTAKSATAKPAAKTTAAKSATAKSSATKAKTTTAKKSTAKTAVKTDAAADTKAKAQGEEQ